MRSLRATACLIFLITFGHGLSGFAQSNQQWIALKQSCGLPMGLAYNTWVSQGSPCPARNAGAANNNAAANAAAEAAAEAAAAAERKRQAELAQARINAENKRRMEEVEDQARFIDDRDAVAGTLRGSTGTAPVGSGESGLRGSSVTPELRGSTPPPEQPITDPMVVDAHHVPTGLPKSVEAEIPDTPAGDRVRKGFEAIQEHDWKVALAWFQDAVNHDPGNAGIQRLIELAAYTMARANRPHPSATPATHASALDKADMAALDRQINKIIDDSLNEDQIARMRDQQILDKQFDETYKSDPSAVPHSQQVDDQMNAGDRAKVDKQMDDRMNADLAKSLADFNRNYLPKHPQLLMPAKPPAPVPAAQPSPVASAPELDNEPIKPNWNVFFDTLFGSAKPSRAPGAVGAVRD